MVEEEFQNDVWISCLKHLLGALYERRRLFISDLRQKSLVMEMLKLVEKPVIQVSCGHLEI